MAGFQSLNKIGVLLTGIVIGLVLFGLALFAIDTRAKTEEPVAYRPESVSSCIERYSGLSHVDYTRIADVYNINQLCYTSSGLQLLIDEEVIRRDNFVFQRHENMILLLMVVAITLSGVLLAGLQLLASYRLALTGKGELAGGGELNYGARDSTVSFKSSVVGLMILVISFAFFLVFVIDVYELKEAKGDSRPGMPPNSTQLSAFVPNAQKPEPTPKQPAVPGLQPTPASEQLTKP